MYKRIVVGIDGSPTADVAMRQAIALAGAFSSEMHVVSVVRTNALAFAAPDAALAGAAVEADNVVREDARLTLEKAAADATAQGISAQTHLSHGDPAEALCTLAIEIGADLIVVGNKGMRGARRLLGSVPNAVSHKAHCAVLIVRTT